MAVRRGAEMEQQVFYENYANAEFPAGCQCPDRSGSCDWCRAYYNGPTEDDITPEAV